jgi:hypothetical protein
MVKRESTAPFLFFILDLPSGISSGFASITLPFILTEANFSSSAGYRQIRTLPNQLVFHFENPRKSA